MGRLMVTMAHSSRVSRALQHSVVNDIKLDHLEEEKRVTVTRVLRILASFGVLAAVLAGTLGGSFQAHRAAAAAKQTLVITLANPYVDPAIYLNAKTKKTDPSDYALAIMTQKIFALFYKMHPDYVIKPVNWGWSDALRQKILLNVAAGIGPDIITGEDFFPEFARDGILVPVNLGAEQKQISPATLSVGEYKGVAYGVPAESGIFALYYNKTLFTKAGLDPNSPPTTWDQWLADSKKIAALGNGISGTATEVNTGLGAAFRLAPFMRQVGGDFTSKDGSTITFNTPANLKALTFMRQIAATQTSGLNAATDEGKWFAAGWWANKAGFVVDGPWEVSSSQQFKLDFGVAQLPVPTGGHPANVVVGNQMFGVLKASKHVSAALDYVRLLGTEQASRLNFQATGRLPINLNVLNNDVPQAGGYLTVFADGLKVPGIVGLPAYPANPAKIWDEWYNVQLSSLGTHQSIASCSLQGPIRL